MLIRSTWTLSVDQPTTLPRSYAVELVKRLHQQMGLEMLGEGCPPIAFSGLVGHAQLSPEGVTFYPDEPYEMVLSGLREVESKAIAQLDLGTVLEFLGGVFRVSDRRDEVTYYESLYQVFVGNEPEGDSRSGRLHQRRIALQFLTPTSFSQDRLNLPLPVPGLMFRSWLERWNAFSPVYLGEADLLGYLGQCVAIAYHRTQTQNYRLPKGTVTGFRGEVTLNVVARSDELLANVAMLLAQYGQFCGTGMKTRLGMGQTRIIDRSDEPIQEPIEIANQ
jgi:CRISPR-associated endoribonuclease Cas6